MLTCYAGVGCLVAIALAVSGVEGARAFLLGVSWPAYLWALGKRLQLDTKEQGIIPVRPTVVHVHRIEVSSDDPDRFVFGMLARAEEITKPE